MSRNGLSVARVVVILGLAIQILGLARLIFLDVGLDRWTASVQNGFGPSIAASAVILALALLYPAGRGRRWALVTTVPVQLLLVDGHPVLHSTSHRSNHIFARIASALQEVLPEEAWRRLTRS